MPKLVLNLSEELNESISVSALKNRRTRNQELLTWLEDAAGTNKTSQLAPAKPGAFIFKP